MNLEDHTGKNIKSWTVIHRDGNDTPTRWICKCKCGTEKSFYAGHIKKNNIIANCGCEPVVRYNDLTGQIFGKLTVIEHSGYYKNNGGTKWLCRCDCGNQTIVSSSHLKSGMSRSCGCFRSLDINEWPEGHKRCYQCLDIKPFSEFHKHRGCVYGYNNICKKCRKPLSQEQYSKQTYEYKMWHAAKSRSKENDIEFTISIDDIKIPEKCPALGVFLNKNVDLSKLSNAPSLDRIDPHKGYTPDNIAVISRRANSIKNDANWKELQQITDWVKSVAKQERV